MHRLVSVTLLSEYIQLMTTEKRHPEATALADGQLNHAMRDNNVVSVGL
jgi:hypothetical protein